METKLCKKCQKQININLFETHSIHNGKERKRNICKSCRHKQKAEYVQANPKYKAKQLANLKQWNKNQAKQCLEWFLHNNMRKYKTRHKKLTNEKSNLTKEYLIELWNQQQGLCYYSKTKLTFKESENKYCNRQADTPSLDRLNPSKGYIKGNVVWCSMQINSMKGDLSEKQFRKICKTISDL